MKKLFFIKLIVFCIPFLLIIVYLEGKCSKIPTNYSVKRDLFERNLNDTEILIVGSSYSYFGINPQYLSPKAHNVAYRAQSIYYDYQLVKKYIDRMPKLKILVINVSFLTLGTQLNDISDSFRCYSYLHYYDIQLQPKVDGALDMNYTLNPKRFSKIALFGNRIHLGKSLKAIIKQKSLFEFENMTDETCTESGWFDSGTTPFNPAKDKSSEGARIHNGLATERNYKVNLKIIKSMVELVRSRGVIPIIVQTPMLPPYTENLDQTKLAIMEKYIYEFAKNNDVKYLDYLYDNRFNNKDMLESLSDHLNSNGARKFTEILNVEILRLLRMG